MRVCVGMMYRDGQITDDKGCKFSLSINADASIACLEGLKALDQEITDVGQAGLFGSI